MMMILMTNKKASDFNRKMRMRKIKERYFVYDENVEKIQYVLKY